MIDSILCAAGVAAIALAATIVAAAQARLRGTTLIPAWNWAPAALAAWGSASVAELAVGVQEASRPAALDLLWHTTALLSLCPPIAVLGARRPGVAAWTWFVLVPLLAVLGWPLLTVWGSGARPHALQLETPQLLGFLLVLLMGTGNYVGTRHWPAACLYALAVCLVIAPMSGWTPDTMPASTARAWASIALGLAAGSTRLRRGRFPEGTSSDRLWNDYRNFYGIVWTRRLQDRINGVAEKEEWPVRAAPLGFVWEEGASPESRAAAAAKLEQHLRWMLRRFVTPEWIDARLGAESDPAC